MKTNKNQKIVLTLGSIALALSMLFPPTHNVLDSAALYGYFVEVNYYILSMQILVIIMISLAMFFVFKK